MWHRLVNASRNKQKRIWNKFKILTKTYGQRNVRSLKCLSGKMSGRWSLFRESVRPGKCPSGKCHSGICPRGSISRWTVHTLELGIFLVTAFQPFSCLWFSCLVQFVLIAFGMEKVLRARFSWYIFLLKTLWYVFIRELGKN